MYIKAIAYLRHIIDLHEDNVLFQMVYKFLQKTKIVPVDDEDDKFVARCYIINNEVVIKYNSNIVKPDSEKHKLWSNIGIRHLAFLLAHEACHVLYGDFEDQYPGKDHKLLNIAMDARINPTLIDPDFALVSNGHAPCLYPEEGKGCSGVYDIHDRAYSVNEIYDLLLNAQQLEQEQQQNSGDSSSDESNKESDNHTSISIKSMCDSQNIDTVKIVNEEGEESDNSIKADIIRLTEDVAEEVAEELEIPIETVLKTINKHRVSAKVKSNWEKVIRKYVQGSGAKSSSRYRTYSRPNKRISLLPGYKTLRYRGVSVFLDVSSSMDEVMQNAVDNISVITQFNNGISTFIGWDEELKFEHYNVNNKQLHKILNNVRCGCTDLYEGFEYFIKKSPAQDILVIISDLDTYNWDKSVELLNKVAKKRTVIIGLPKYYNADCKKDLSKVIFVELK